MKNSKVLIFLILLGFVWSFASGIFIAYLIFKPPQPPIEPPSAKGEFLEEYDIVAVSEAVPHKVLVFDLLKSGENFYGSAHYFNGASWESQSLIFKDDPIGAPASQNKFVSSISIGGSISRNEYVLSVPEIYTNMVIRAEKNYGKFGGATQKPSNYLFINNEPIKSNVALLKGYNSNYVPEDIKELGVQTDWLMFWDKEFNFYHLDKTEVLNPSPDYDSHKFFSMISRAVDNFGSVSYFSDISIKVTQAEVVVNYIRDGEPRSLKMNLGLTYRRPGYEDMAISAVVFPADGGIGIYTRLDTAGVGY